MGRSLTLRAMSRSERASEQRVLQQSDSRLGDWVVESDSAWSALISALESKFEWGRSVGRSVSQSNGQPADPDEQTKDERSVDERTQTSKRLASGLGRASNTTATCEEDEERLTRHKDRGGCGVGVKREKKRSELVDLVGRKTGVLGGPPCRLVAEACARLARDAPQVTLLPMRAPTRARKICADVI